MVWSRPLPQGAEPSTVTVSQDSAGRWFVSLLCEDASVEPLPVLDAAVGIDAGITSPVTPPTGEKIANPRHERQDRARLARAQRVLAKKEEGSRNRGKARLKVAEIHARIADRRRDFLHRLTTRLVRENRTVVIGGPTVRNMVRNKSPARAISDAAWTDLRSRLEYQGTWYGRNLVAIDRWLPSTQLCSACGTLPGKLPLHLRRWTCECGTTHDRDTNAARKVLAAGLAVAACGAGVGPQRESSRTGQPAAKQETLTAKWGLPFDREGEGVEMARLRAMSPCGRWGRNALPQPLADRLRTVPERRRNAVWERLGAVNEGTGESADATYRRLAGEMIAAERAVFVELRDRRRIDDEMLRSLMRRLDPEEAAAYRAESG